MRIVVALQPTDPVERIEDVIAVRGHRARRVELAALEQTKEQELVNADLIIVDAELAGRLDLATRLATASPGIELVLVGPGDGSPHPDVIEQLARPVDVDRLLSVVDEVADILDGERLREPIDLVAYETLFAGDSPEIRELLRRVRLVARSQAPVWIFGDDGSGRSIIARAIHDRSVRRSQPFLAFSCAAYADDDLCRRLFDGDQAAVNTARAGTLFIERIGAAGPITQRELVNYLETAQNYEASTRMIVGIQRDKAIDGAQHFVSPELYYRLKVLEIEIPSLAARARDLEQIVVRMLGRLAPDSKQLNVSGDAMRLLERYTFPGNLLELAHALTHAFVLARGGAIEPQHLPISIRKATSDGELARALDGELEALDVVAKRFERDYLLRVLRSVGGNRGRAAEILGLSRKGLWGKLKSHAISDDDIDGGAG
jgi:two-component system, NtrC family, response regulator AtoC